MAAGMGLLALPPAQFWRSTPKEIDAALHGRLGLSVGHSRFARQDLERLMQAFPDSQT